MGITYRARELGDGRLLGDEDAEHESIRGRGPCRRLDDAEVQKDATDGEARRWGQQASFRLVVSEQVNPADRSGRRVDRATPCPASLPPLRCNASTDRPDLTGH